MAVDSLPSSLIASLIFVDCLPHQARMASLSCSKWTPSSCVPASSRIRPSRSRYSRWGSLHSRLGARTSQPSSTPSAPSIRRRASRPRSNLRLRRRWEISSRPLVWPDGSSKSLRARARDRTLVTARVRTLVMVCEKLRASSRRTALRPLADEEGNPHALRGLSDAPLAGGAAGQGGLWSTIRVKAGNVKTGGPWSYCSASSRSVRLRYVWPLPPV